MLQSMGSQRVGHDWVTKQKQHITMGFPGGLVSKESTCNAGDPGSIPGLGRTPGEGNGNPLQYSCWKIPRTEEPGRLQSLGRIRHDLGTKQQTMESTCLTGGLAGRGVWGRMDTRVCMAEFLLCHLKLSRCSLAMLLLFSHGGVSDPL